MSAPRLTVLMTLFNKGPFVEEAVRSVLTNSYGDLELLVVDDASTDDGVARVAAIPDPRIRVLRLAVNAGRGAAANHGLHAARGEFLAVLDADDLAHPDRFAKQIAYLDAHPEVGIVGSAAKVFGARERTVSWPATDEQARAVMLFEDPLLYGSCMYRRELCVRHGIRYREDWRVPGMDYLFLLAMAAHARMANLPEALTSYRLGEQNFRHGKDSRDVRRAIIAEALRWFGIPGTEREVELMLMLEQRRPAVVDEDMVRALWEWVKRLRGINRERGLFPIDAFERRLQRDWRRWFYLLADESRELALAHMRCEGGLPLGRLFYLARSASKRRARRAVRP